MMGDGWVDAWVKQGQTHRVGVRGRRRDGTIIVFVASRGVHHVLVWRRVSNVAGCLAGERTRGLDTDHGKYKSRKAQSKRAYLTANMATEPGARRIGARTGRLPPTACRRAGAGESDLTPPTMVTEHEKQGLGNVESDPVEGSRSPGRHPDLQSSTPWRPVQDACLDLLPRAHMTRGAAWAERAALGPRSGSWGPKPHPTRLEK